MSKQGQMYKTMAQYFGGGTKARTASIPQVKGQPRADRIKYLSSESGGVVLIFSYTPLTTILRYFQFLYGDPTNKYHKNVFFDISDLLYRTNRAGSRVLLNNLGYDLYEGHQYPQGIMLFRSKDTPFSRSNSGSKIIWTVHPRVPKSSQVMSPRAREALKDLREANFTYGTGVGSQPARHAYLVSQDIIDALNIISLPMVEKIQNNTFLRSDGFSLQEFQSVLEPLLRTFGRQTNTVFSKTSFNAAPHFSLTTPRRQLAQREQASQLFYPKHNRVVPFPALYPSNTPELVQKDRKWLLVKRTISDRDVKYGWHYSKGTLRSPTPPISLVFLNTHEDGHYAIIEHFSDKGVRSGITLDVSGVHLHGIPMDLRTKKGKTQKKQQKTRQQVVIKGKNIVFTGTFPGLTRTQIGKKIKEMGGTLQKGVTKTTQLVIRAQKPGKSKIAKAQKQGIRVVSYQQVKHRF